MSVKSDQEHKFTSTGIKYWYHYEQMKNYQLGLGKTIISTHISPEGSCNLNCRYCSVKKRNKYFRIELDVIKDYIEKLIPRGLKAVILTGGGEPLLYPRINELVRWLKYEKNLSLALITNGTRSNRLHDWSVFSWVRVSLNEIDSWKEVINLPIEKIPSSTVIGCSYINTGNFDSVKHELSYMLDKLNAKYLRILPNCLLNQEELLKEHEKIINSIEDCDTRFFHQFKIHGTPKDSICHQSYFRPYLSEIDGGSVYPCDSLVLNDNVERFDEKYRICKAEDIELYLDRVIKPMFKPCNDCKGCVFTENVDMLGNWKNNEIEFKEPQDMILHTEFV